MGKPKKNAKTSQRDEIKKVVDLGKRVRYIGLLNAKFTCHYCSRSFKRGMVSEYKDNLYCSEDCIKIENKLSA